MAKTKKKKLNTEDHVQTTLVLQKTCKSCVRYSSEQGSDEPLMVTAYIINDAVKALGMPDKIDITVTAADDAKPIK